MKYKLKNINTSDLNVLKNNIYSGAKFIIFPYRIGLGFISLLRFSPAFLIKKESELVKYKSKYNNINLIFGPWFLFRGPILTYNAYKTTKKGGIDITKDIMLNLNEEQLKNKQVELIKLHNIFSTVLKSDKKNITKAIKKIDTKIVPLKHVYTGLFTNTEEYIEPYVVIGIELNNDSILNIEHVKEKLYSVFNTHVPFDVFNVKEDTNFGDKLIEQGELIQR